MSTNSIITKRPKANIGFDNGLGDEDVNILFFSPIMAVAWLLPSSWFASIINLPVCSNFVNFISNAIELSPIIDLLKVAIIPWVYGDNLVKSVIVICSAVTPSGLTLSILPGGPYTLLT